MEVHNHRGFRIMQTRSEKHRPLIIPIFLPHAGCPHQCVFCNQSSITGVKEKSLRARALQSRINNFLEYDSGQRRPVEIAFFGGNFLGQPAEAIQMLLTEATKYVVCGKADSIRFSTRPDSIDRQHLDLIVNFPVSTVELGVQSMDPAVLRKSRRGHDGRDTEQAVGLLKNDNYRIGAQIMIGLPGDTPQKAMNTGQRVVDLKPDFVRIYPTLVIQGSPLAQWHKTGKYHPLLLEAAVSQVKDLYLLMNNAGIPVIRMGLQHEAGFDDPETILAGPYHPAFGHLVYSEIFFDGVKRVMASNQMQTKTLEIRVHPRNVSRMQGLKNENIRKLNSLFHLKSVGIISDPGIAINKLMINGRCISIYN
jgi:histone acetyltransferase (RNA polymerase elongator complex component)